jgi:hypothetical protein
VSVYQVSWLPGSDHLFGRCHCGAELVASDPIEMWVWLLGHPDGHRRADDLLVGAAQPGAVP